MSIAEVIPLADARKRSVDPTNTSGIRKKWQAAAKLHLNRLRAQLRVTIMDHDILGLGGSDATNIMSYHPAETRLEAFHAWLNAAATQELNKPWYYNFVQQAWQSGINAATKEVGHRIKHDAAIPRSSADLMQKLAQHEIQGIVGALIQQVSREAQRVMHKKRAVAWRDIAKVFDKIGEPRLKLWINTLTVMSHNKAKLSVYRTAGITHVGIDPELRKLGKGVHRHDHSMRDDWFMDAGYNPSEERDEHGKWAVGEKFEEVRNDITKAIEKIETGPISKHVLGLATFEALGVALSSIIPGGVPIALASGAAAYGIDYLARKYHVGTKVGHALLLAGAKSLRTKPEALEEAMRKSAWAGGAVGAFLSAGNPYAAAIGYTIGAGIGAGKAVLHSDSDELSIHQRLQLLIEALENHTIDAKLLDYDPNEARDPQTGRWTASGAEQAVQSVLTPDLLKGKYRGKAQQGKLAGHCYAASQAAYHMLGGKEAGWKPMYLNHEQFPEGLAKGETHWFIKHENGHIVDPTGKQFAGTVPYHKAVAVGFLTKEPDTRAKEIIQRVGGLGQWPTAPTPTQTTPGYKTFTVKEGKLYPAMVKKWEKRSIPLNTWIEADFKGKEPSLADRPGWHMGFLPMAPKLRSTDTHKIQPFRVWAEVEMGTDKELHPNAKGLRGEPPKPGEFYHHKQGRERWMIGGSVRVKRLLSDLEVHKILTSHGIPEEEARHEMHDAGYDPGEARDPHGMWTSGGGDELVAKAQAFATAAHARIGQTRKYTGEPYIIHPEAVVAIVKTVPHTPEMLAAAWMHDVVEDTGISHGEVEAEFGKPTADLVGWLTDVSKPSDGNRAVRKAIDREHTSQAPAEAQTIKLADLIHNTESIRQHDPDFYKVYQKEKIALLNVLTKGDPELQRQAWAQIGEPQTVTPAFKSWFSESKVVDKDGKPLVVYHATENEFSTFEHTEDFGFHFGTAKAANDYLKASHFKLPKGEETLEEWEGTRIIPVYLSIQNPLWLPDLGDWEPNNLLTAFEEAGVMSDIEVDKARETDQLIDREFVDKVLRNHGYDGIKYVNTVEGKREISPGILENDLSYIVTRPEQIKSATGNKGTFDPTKPDIRDAYEEEQHPRGEHGRWIEKGGGGQYPMPFKGGAVHLHRGIAAPWQHGFSPPETIMVKGGVSNEPFKVMRNPHEEDVRAMIQKSDISRVNVARDEHGNLYIWDQQEADHAHVAEQLQLGEIETDEWHEKDKELLGEHLKEWKIALSGGVTRQSPASIIASKAAHTAPWQHTQPPTHETEEEGVSTAVAHSLERGRNRAMGEEEESSSAYNEPSEMPEPGDAHYDNVHITYNPGMATLRREADEWRNDDEDRLGRNDPSHRYLEYGGEVWTARASKIQHGLIASGLGLRREWDNNVKNMHTGFIYRSDFPAIEGHAGGLAGWIKERHRNYEGDYGPFYVPEDEHPKTTVSAENKEWISYLATSAARLEKLRQQVEHREAIGDVFDPSEERDEHGRWTTGAGETEKEYYFSPGHVRAFHGTTSDVIENILKDGISVNRDHTFGDQWYTGSRGESVFITADHGGALDYATHATARLSNRPVDPVPVIFQLSVPEQEWDHFERDEEDELNLSKIAPHIPPEWIKSYQLIDNDTLQPSKTVKVRDGADLIRYMVIHVGGSDARDAFDPSEERDEHGRWTAGAAEHVLKTTGQVPHGEHLSQQAVKHLNRMVETGHAERDPKRGYIATEKLFRHMNCGPLGCGDAECLHDTDN